MEPRAKELPAVSALFGRFRRPILLIAALIILILGYFAVLANPLRIYQENFSLLGQLNSDIGVAQGDLQTSKIFAGKLYQLSPLESKLLDMALPPRPDDSALIAQLTASVSKAGFSASNIDIEETNGVANSKIASDKIGKISIRLKLKGGGYEELKQLLKLLESSLLAIDVYSVNFTVKSPVYDLTLVAYYYNAGAK